MGFQGKGLCRLPQRGILQPRLPEIPLVGPQTGLFGMEEGTSGQASLGWLRSQIDEVDGRYALCTDMNEYLKYTITVLLGPYSRLAT